MKTLNSIIKKSLISTIQEIDIKNVPIQDWPDYIMLPGKDYMGWEYCNRNVVHITQRQQPRGSSWIWLDHCVDSEKDNVCHYIAVKGNPTIMKKES